MTRSDWWITTLIVLIIFSACLPVGHIEIPDKADTPTEPTEVVIPPTKEAIPRNTPLEKTACEYEVDDLRNDLDAAREIIRNFSCYCDDE